MAYKFNPFTGNFDITSTSSGGSSTDHHASWRVISSSQSVTIDASKQMIVFGEFLQDGTLLIEGDLILED